MARARPRRGAAATPPRSRSPRAAGSRRRASVVIPTRVLVLSGPNLDRLGRREPEIYGSVTLAEIHERLADLAKALDAEVVCRQSNHEGLLIDWINAAGDEGFDGLLLNPGALTHTSIALYDSLKCAGLPAVEVHLSNPDAREAFRRRSRIAPACLGRIMGFGAESYSLALRGLVSFVAAAKAAKNG